MTQDLEPIQGRLISVFALKVLARQGSADAQVILDSLTDARITNRNGNQNFLLVAEKTDSRHGKLIPGIGHVFATSGALTANGDLPGAYYGDADSFALHGKAADAVIVTGDRSWRQGFNGHAIVVALQIEETGDVYTQAGPAAKGATLQDLDYRFI